ncbi:MAG TPA: aldo/keto reductase [Anaerolineales bacterium]|nr:aldo/keto reductase [Anaerolineales bacterium]
MTNSQSADKSQVLRDLPPYIYGTTRLGDQNLPFEDRVTIGRAAMKGTTWFHTSHAYGNALQVLRAAFDQDSAHIPKLIVKIGWKTIEELRDVIQKHLIALRRESLEVGQLCLSDSLAEEYASGGACYEEFARLKQQGLINRFVLEVFPWTSDVALQALRRGYSESIVDGYIFYLNPLQRFASNELWDELVQRNEPMIAMRTIAGGNIHRLRDVPGYAWKSYLQERAAEVTPIFERSGIESWTEFCVRFAHSFPLVRATVGATSKLENLKEFLSAAENIEPLPEDMIEEIVKMHYRWSDELDMKAEHWSM